MTDPKSPMHTKNPKNPDSNPFGLLPSDHGAGGKTGPRRVESKALFGPDSVVLIDHDGETYALRRTRLGKLILTK